VGADLVNTAVNDILVQGAEPLFLSDYLATGRLSPDVAEPGITGVAAALQGKRRRRCSLANRREARFLRRCEYDLDRRHQSSGVVAIPVIMAGRLLPATG